MSECSFKKYENRYPRLFAKGALASLPPGWESVVLDVLAVAGMWSWKDAVLGESKTILDYMQVEQVKEKFGGLRFYFSFHTSPHDYKGNDVSREKSEYMHGVMSYAEHLAVHKCQECGAPAQQRNKGGWFATLCDHHAA
jgi:hypothetical protein